MGIIYKIYNDINDKIYIGQTSRTLEERWYEHCRAGLANKPTKLYQAMYQYGIENFHIVPIEEDIDTKLLLKKESEYINLYDSFNNGYNSNTGSGNTNYKNRTVKTSISDEEKAYIEMLYFEGSSCKEISQLTSLSINQVERILKKEGIEINRKNNLKYVGHPITYNDDNYVSDVVLARKLVRNKNSYYYGLSVGQVIKIINKNLYNDTFIDPFSINREND